MDSDGCYKCGNCYEIKSWNEFYKNKRTKSGHASQCKDCAKLKAKTWYKNNEDYRLKKREFKLTYQKIWRNTHPNHNKIYKLNNRKKLSEQESIRQKRLYKTDKKFRLLVGLRSRIYTVLKKNRKPKSSLELLGCSIDFLKKHLESKFTEGMSWDNYGKGGWEVDHIRPCASFDLSNPEEQKKCFHYTNLQPLWATDNRRKGAKYGLYF